MNKQDKQMLKAVKIAVDYGFVDGKQHKAWVIDQMVKTLLSPNEYAQLKKAYPEWNEGIKP